MLTPLLALAILIRPLPLPLHSTIASFGPRPMMAVARDGTVAATITLGGFTTRAIEWNGSGGWHLVPAPAFAAEPATVDLSVAAFDTSGMLLLNAEAHYDDGSVPTRYRSARVAGTLPAAVDFGSCDYPRNSAGAVLAGSFADGDLVATMESPSLVDLDDLSGQLAPVVVRLRGGECAYLGNGIALGTAGAYAVGYAGYTGNVPQSSNVAVKERFVALRWHGDERRVIGTGAALGVNAEGVAIGADAPPGLGTAYAATPHALLWPLGAPAVELAPGSPISVGYAVDADGRAVGMLQDADGRHHAFLWENGRLQRLDDLVHSPDWHFEAAYAFAPDGAIAGIGTYRGTATAFVIDGL